MYIEHQKEISEPAACKDMPSPVTESSHLKTKFKKKQRNSRPNTVFTIRKIEKGDLTKKFTMAENEDE